MIESATSHSCKMHKLGDHATSNALESQSGVQSHKTDHYGLLKAVLIYPCIP